MQKVTMLDRVLSDDKIALKANKISADFGFKPARNKEQLRENLRIVIADPNVGEKALLRLGTIHPDRELILASAGVLSEDKMNCSGCDGKCGQKMSGDGEETPKAEAPVANKQYTVKSFFNEYGVMIGTTLVALAAVSVIYKQTKSK